MAGKILNSSEAAAMLGISEDQLALMRQKNEIFGRRDGSTWNYKSEEVERVIAERGGSAVLGGDEFDGLLAELSSPTQAGGPILVSEEELGRSPEGTSSTIIGKKESAKSAGDSDLQLAPEGDALGSGISGIKPASGILGGSDLKLTGSGTGTGSGIKGGSDVELGGGLELGDDELSLAAESNKFTTAPKPADDDDSDEIDLDSDSVGMASGSVIGSGIGSDITLRGGDSGINLKPTDSGLSLEEEPLDLGGSAVDSLELPEDDDVISLDEEAADPDMATQLKQDDQFLLSPSDALSDDESDSGSQVIALEDSESFDADAATMLRSGGVAPMQDDPFGAAPMDAFGQAPMDAFGAAPMDAFGAVSPMGGVAPITAMPGSPAGQPVYVQVPVIEAPYSLWNVLGLFFVAVMMICCCMLTVDILLNMWSFDKQSSMSMALMDLAIDTFQLDK